MEKIDKETVKKILEFYLSMNTLKDIPRTGWLDWSVNRDRIESVADHVYGTQQLAYVIWSEFDVPVNIDRVLAMLAFHETEEPVIGDIPLVHDLKKYKKEMGEIAVDNLVSKLSKNTYIRNLIAEFEECKTPEAKFAKYVDKLECDLQSKIYDEEDTVDVNDQENNASSKVPLVKQLLDEGKSFGEMWMEFGRNVYNYPQEFNDVSEYAEKNNLHDIRDNNVEEAKNKVKEYLNKIKNL